MGKDTEAVVTLVTASATTVRRSPQMAATPGSRMGWVSEPSADRIQRLDVGHAPMQTPEMDLNAVMMMHAPKGLGKHNQQLRSGAAVSSRADDIVPAKLTQTWHSIEWRNLVLSGACSAEGIDSIVEISFVRAAIGVPVNHLSRAREHRPCQ
jgi:hypothetical protein